MIFKVGDKVKFKKFEDLPSYLKEGSSGRFHRIFDEREATIAQIIDNQFSSNHRIDGIMVDIDIDDKFVFRSERFVKVNKIKLNDDLFQL